MVLLAFLGAGVVVFCGAIAGAASLAARRMRLARLFGGTALAVAVVYGALLLAAALLARGRTLAAGEKKYFCEIDCHLAYSIAGGVIESGPIRVVTVETWFDPSTIASFRGDQPLAPNPRMVYLVDEAGRRFPPSSAATKAWEERHGRSTPWTQALRPGESYTTTLVFEMPEAVRARSLFVGDPPGPERFIIGHENSPFHPKTYFGLPDPKGGAARYSGLPFPRSPPFVV